MKVLITGSGGLIGSESCKFFLEKGHNVLGIDNNLRKYFFGNAGDTSGNIAAIQRNYGNERFKNYSIDLRERKEVINFFKKLGPFDVVNAFWHFIQNPKQGEAYNLGGCKENSASILEVINILDKDFGLKLKYTYIDNNRIGDHICYYSDMSKFKRDFPEWKITRNLKEIIEEIIEGKK